MEQSAARIVARFGEYKPRQLDQGRGTQLPDFELLRMDGSVAGYLEVSSSLPSARLSFESAVQRKLIELPGSRYDWQVTFRGEPPQVSGLAKRLRTLLQEVETHLPKNRQEVVYLEIFHPSDHRFFGRLPSDLNEKLYDRQVDRLELFPAPTSRDGIVRPALENVTNLTANPAREIQQVLDKPDNVAKLEYGDSGTHTEVFVWLQETPAATQLRGILSNFHDSGLLTAPPSVPEKTRRVWVATLPIEVDPFALVVWSYTSQTGWSLHAPRRGREAV